MIYILDFRASDVGGAVVPGRLIRPAGPVAFGTEDDLVRESKFTFVIHGFNVSRRDGRERLVYLANRLPSAADGAILAVLWPGDHWVGPASYPFEGNDADDSAAELARYIERVIPPGSPLGFVSHSLGARVVMETLKRLIGRGYAIGPVCLMAAAIDDFSLADPEDYRNAVDMAERIAVLASHEDEVLKLAYPTGDLLQAFIFFWRDSAGLAAGYHGPKPSGEHPLQGHVYHFQIPDVRNSDHGDYIPDSSPSANQLSAAAFADQVLKRVGAPQYP
ncbi:MAG TPA: alpha/beta hydrolase [Candidatus Eisenbacteria bacterium]|nr:alpha/beta hydrolase [Candidatus Eisenbacteria bacterium]